MELIRGDCLKEIKKVSTGSVDMILIDPPYGNMNGAGLDGWKHNKTNWDFAIAPIMIHEIANRVLRMNGKMLVFSQEPYTSQLITQAITNIPFSYRMIWKKDHFANALIAKKAPVNYFEDMLVFSKEYDIEKLHPLRKYAKNVMDFIGLGLKSINKRLGHRKAEHFFYLESTQFGICTEQVYFELILVFNIDKMKDFIDYKTLVAINIKYEPKFNLWKGGKFKSNVFEYKKDYTGLHPTQKPVALIEDLIKTYTDEGETILDFTMGSGTTGVACKNLNRDFIGIELDKKYFEIAKKRIEEIKT